MWTGDAHHARHIREERATLGAISAPATTATGAWQPERPKAGRLPFGCDLALTASRRVTRNEYARSAAGAGAGGAGARRGDAAPIGADQSRRAAIGACPAAPIGIATGLAGAIWHAH